MIQYEMAQLAGKHVLIKLSGELIDDLNLLAYLAEDVKRIADARLRVTLVHGGGPQIERRLVAKGFAQPKVDGLRPTSAAAVGEVRDVLCNEVNVQVVTALERAGAKAVGLCGESDGILQAGRLESSTVDYGHVGKVTRVDVDKLERLAGDSVAVVAPVAAGEGEVLNVNADEAANAVAVALGCAVLVMVTDTDGVLGHQGETLASLDQNSIELLKQDGIIKDGMVPKVDSAISALEAGVGKCKIVNGRRKSALFAGVAAEGGQHGTTISLTLPEDSP